MKLHKRKALGSYYTPQLIAEASVMAIADADGFEPTLIVEPSAGLGALSKSALIQWPAAKLSWMDIDRDCLVNSEYSGGIHGDFLTDWKRLSYSKQTQAIIVANPPFGKISNSDLIRRGMFKSGLLSLTSGRRKTIPSELVFLSNCIRLLSPRSRLNMILPSVYFTGERWSKLRADLLSSHEILVTTNIENAFSATETNVCIFSLRPRNGGGSASCSDFQTKEEWPIDDLSFIHGVPHGIDDQGALSGISITRGSCSKAEFKKLGIQAAHTDLNLQTACKSGEALKHRISSFGDILIPRVGRNLLRVERNTLGDLVYTDCVFNISTTEEKGKGLFEFLQSDVAASFIASRKKGTCAKYITKTDVFDLCRLGFG